MSTLNSLRVLGKVGNLVYQRVQPGLGNVPDDPTRSLQVRAWVSPVMPDTPAMQTRHALMRAAVAEWHTLTPEQKAAWKPQGENRRITAFNAFVSARLRAPVSYSDTTWDGGQTTWDAGTTFFDKVGATSFDNGATTWDGGATIFDYFGSTIFDAGATSFDDQTTFWD